MCHAKFTMFADDVRGPGLRIDTFVVLRPSGRCFSRFKRKLELRTILVLVRENKRIILSIDFYTSEQQHDHCSLAKDTLRHDI